MTTKQSQIIAIEKGVRSNTKAQWDTNYHKLQKDDLFRGQIRTYRSVNDEGELFPSESHLVQLHAKDVVTATSNALKRMFDVVATKDYNNCYARADITVSGQVLAADVPVTTLLWLEKQLTDIHTFVKSFPTLDPGRDWTPDEATNLYRSEPVDSTKTKKVMRAFEKAPATQQHAAQVETYTEDQIIGYWTTTYYSGAFTQKDKDIILTRVDEVSEAVKVAREEANSIEVQDKHIGKSLLDYIFS